METLGGIPNEIKNVLGQIKTTGFNTGHLSGHLISQAQFEFLEDCVSRLETIDKSRLHNIAESNLSEDFLTLRLTPDPSVNDTVADEEHEARAQRQIIKRDIQRKQIELSKAKKEDRSSINNEIGKLLSKRSKIDRLLKSIERTQNLL